MTQPYQPQPQPVQPQPTKKHGNVFWALVGGGVIIVVVAIIGPIGGEDEDSTVASAPSSAATDTNTVPPPAEETTTAPEPEPSNCKPLKKSQLKEITPGLEGGSARVKSGVWVPLDEEYQFGFNQVIALALTDGSVATFATENLGKSDQGLLMAVNGTARKHFTWGAAVRPGSPMDDDLQAVKDSAEYTEAVDCARGQA